MKFTWTQQLLLGHLATKYLGHGWGNYEDIDLSDLYQAMVHNGANIIEFGAMAEQFKDFLSMCILNT